MSQAASIDSKIWRGSTWRRYTRAEMEENWPHGSAQHYSAPRRQLQSCPVYVCARARVYDELVGIVCYTRDRHSLFPHD